jgi:cation/acetate symporter
LSASTFFPALVAGIFWRRCTRAGVVAGMLAGAGVTLCYMLLHVAAVRSVFGGGSSALWWGIQPVSAGVFGVVASTLTLVVVSLATRAGAAPAPQINRGL